MGITTFVELKELMQRANAGDVHAAAVGYRLCTAVQNARRRWSRIREVVAVRPYALHLLEYVAMRQEERRIAAVEEGVLDDDPLADLGVRSDIARSDDHWVQG